MSKYLVQDMKFDEEEVIYESNNEANSRFDRIIGAIEDIIMGIKTQKLLVALVC